MGATALTSAGEPAESTDGTVELPAFVVSAARVPQPLNTLPVAVDQFGAADLSAGAAFTIDDALRASPAFSLFRRTSSLTAHPTAQGVSLRGIGPSGASRSLVLLDGIPLNDPFGGWVAWSKVPRLALGSAEIVRGGGSGMWGSSTLGGVVQVLSRPYVAGASVLSAELGEFSTRRAEVASDLAAGTRGVLRAGARWFATDGFHQYRPEQRGPVDRPLDSRHALVHAAYSASLVSGLRVTAGGRVFDEERGNGTPFQRNASRESAASLRLAGELSPGLSIDAVGYAQSQTFSSGFSTVGPARASETPSLDQFDVPATAYGAATVLSWDHGDSAATTAGGDFRSARGETREAFLYSNGRFLRHRYAGGKQLSGGIFGAHRRKLSTQWSAQVAARLDGWSLDEGHRREVAVDSGAIVRDDRYPAREGWEFSPSLGLVWSPDGSTRVRAAAYQAFRVPTLNEFYRPFRVGNVATDANPGLANERLGGVDAGVDWSRGRWRVSVGGFACDLEDAVANVVVASTPVLVERRRENLDLARIQGLEATATWSASEVSVVSMSYLLADATVRRATLAPGLEGMRLPQVPAHTLAARLDLALSPHVRAQIGVRWVSEQFEDDENTLPLAAATTVDLAVTRTFAGGLEVGLAVENLFETEVEASRSAAGLVGLGSPRLARFQAAVRW